MEVGLLVRLLLVKAVLEIGMLGLVRRLLLRWRELFVFRMMRRERGRKFRPRIEVSPVHRREVETYTTSIEGLQLKIWGF